MQRRSFVAKALTGTGAVAATLSAEAIATRAHEELAALKGNVSDVKATLEKRVETLGQELLSAKRAASAKMSHLQWQVSALQAKQTLMLVWLVALSVATGFDWLSPWVATLAA